ncbi:hypothetical protein IV500_05105 [Paeniglutamicibacter antarcticus]|uniref:Uncharacterized protein n=1 Tax=Arthrobacter terrae TaxID=2935737 RepID=A0A931CKT9_9MICC|nr:hypothetical protein [Arthrobacter terrae]MBG0738797.1 hypothetical protein [Arthrobacter terrae]
MDVPALTYRLLCSSLPDGTPFADLATPSVARNRCWDAVDHISRDKAVASAVHKALGVTCPAGDHYATAVTGSDGREVIIDFTARQLDPEAAFPLVTDRWTWQLMVERALKRQTIFTDDEYSSAA